MSVGAALAIEEHHCGPSCTHASWWLYGVKPRPTLRQRETPEARDLIYRWESACLGHLEHAYRLGPASAETAEAQAAVVAAVTAYTTALWHRYAGEYRPRTPSPPRVLVRFGDAQTGDGWSKASASVKRHRLLFDHRGCRRAWAVHEISHLLIPSRDHGSQWRECVMRLWAEEFNIPVERSLALAKQHGVAVAS